MTQSNGQRRPIYLDHNATTPLDPEVLAAMMPFFTEKFGNASSIEHAYGSEAAAAVERAREQIAAAIGAEPKEILFTGSCTEANNLAIFGAARANQGKRHLVTTQIEHPSVLEAFQQLEREGFSATYLPVDGEGRVDPALVAASLTKETALVSVMAANNEVGTLQPVRDIGAICMERGVPFHSDLAQVTAYTELDVERDDLQLASLSAHKAYGPKGIGALYVRSRRPRVKLSPILFGGGQERGLRPGTLNTPLIVGMGEALIRARATAPATAGRLRAMCCTLVDRIKSKLDGVCLNGHPTQRLANNVSLSIEGLEPLALMRLLRDRVCFSASSACATREMRTSHVLLAMFGDTSRARQAFRLAPGRFTSEQDLHAAVDLIIDGVARLREAMGQTSRGLR